MHAPPVFDSPFLCLFGPSEVFRDKRLLLVGTGGLKRTPVMIALRSLGLGRISCLNDVPNWAAPFVDEFIEGSPVMLSRETTEAVLALHRRAPFDGVFTFDEYSVTCAAQLAELLGLPGNPPDAVRAVKNKASFRARCVDAGIRSPGFLLLGTGEPPSRQVQRAGLRYPLVYKPAFGAGSIYVGLAHSGAELDRETARVYAAMDGDATVQRLWTNSSLLVEEYLEGPEVDVDLLLQRGECAYAQVTDNLPPPEGHFVEVGGRLPSSLSTAEQKSLIACAQRTLAAVGVLSGCIHFEAKLTPQGPVPIEANLRLGGAEVFALHSAAYGVNLLEQAVRIAVGLAPTIPQEPPLVAHAASRDFLPDRPGLLRGISRTPASVPPGALVEFVVFRREGEAIAVPPASYDYLGWLVACGDSPAAASRALTELASSLHFILESP